MCSSDLIFDRYVDLSSPAPIDFGYTNLRLWNEEKAVLLEMSPTAMNREG